MICPFCDNTFSTKGNVRKHISNKRCSLKNLQDSNKLLEIFDKLQDKNITNNINASNIAQNGNFIQININVNPITKLDTKHVEPEKMKKLVEEYTYEKLNLLLSDYIEDIIHNKKVPDNHCVKYVKKKPPTYSSIIEKDGETITVIKNLKDSCELLSQPVLETLKKKLKECNRLYKTDEEFQNMYEDTIKDVYRELNKDTVKKALRSVLEDSILNDIEMKIKVATLPKESGSNLTIQKE